MVDMLLIAHKQPCEAEPAHLLSADLYAELPNKVWLGDEIQCPAGDAAGVEWQ
jgi:hypothetical protein